MRAGITATQIGINTFQREKLKHILVTKNVNTLIHGDCIGGDAASHEVARALGIAVYIFPPIKSDKRAWCVANDQAEPDDYIKRNHAIVNASDFLIGMPKSEFEELRSGTWATIRYAKKIGIKVMIIFPKKLEIIPATRLTFNAIAAMI
jgi:hypothetical protein